MESKKKKSINDLKKEKIDGKKVFGGPGNIGPTNNCPHYPPCPAGCTKVLNPYYSVTKDQHQYICR